MMNPILSQAGPDQLIPSESFRTWDQDGAVKIRKCAEFDIAPMSLVSLIDVTCRKAGAASTALKYKVNPTDPRWTNVTYEDYHKNIQAVARAFVKLGLEPLRSVAILGFNSPEWFLSEMGAIYAGGMSVGLYPTNNLETNKFVMNDSRANIFVCEDAAMAELIWNCRDELPHLKKIIVYPQTTLNLTDVIGWDQLMRLGNAYKNNGALKERHKTMAVNQCAKLIYTSGTTGNPKGVMLSHDNVYWTCMQAVEIGPIEYDKEVIISYLPLSHIAASLMDIWGAFIGRATVIFADRMALKGTLLTTLKEARPTIFMGVPRVWEKIHEGMMEKARTITGLKKTISANCKKAGLKHHLEGRDGFFYTLGKKAIYVKVKEALGLDRCHCFLSGAAPIHKDIMKYFLSLDIVIRELYGMSETTGPHTIMRRGDINLGSVGTAMAGCRVLLHDKDPEGNGEVWMWGRNIMMGYLNREDKTCEDLDAQGYVHSGDIGSMASTGHLFITGRIKELIITAGGENVAPVMIEDHIKKELPCVSNAIVIGDKRKYLTVFLTFKVVIETGTEKPTDTLAPGAVEWCRTIGSRSTSVSEIISGPDHRVMRAIQGGIDRANKNAVSRAANVQKWTILPVDVSIPGGELGPTLKLKRFYFNKKYSHAIDKLYS